MKFVFRVHFYAVFFSTFKMGLTEKLELYPNVNYNQVGIIFHFTFQEYERNFGIWM